MLWKHTDLFTGSAETRRQRRLVVSFFATVGNYDYGFYWYLYLDGTIEMEAKVTGVLFTGVVRERSAPTRRGRARPRRAVPPAPVLRAAGHDGRRRAQRGRRGRRAAGAGRRRATRTATRSPAGHPAPTRESEGGRMADRTPGGRWRIVNPGRRNRLGQPTGLRAAPAGPARCCSPTPARRSPGARRSRRSTCGSPGTTRPSATRPATTSTSTRAAAGLAGVRRPRTGDRRRGHRLWHTFGTTHFPRPGGLAGDAGRPVRVHPAAGRVLRPQPALDVPATPARIAAARRSGGRARTHPWTRVSAAVRRVPLT